jgi:hypothetical protein
MKLLRFTFKTDIRVGLSERSSATGARGRKSNANPMGGSTIVFIGRRRTCFNSVMALILKEACEEYAIISQSPY